MSLKHCLVLKKQTRELVRNVLGSKDVLGFHSCTIYQRIKAVPSTSPLPTRSVKLIFNTSRGFSTYSPLQKNKPTAPSSSSYDKDALPPGTPYQPMEELDLALPPDAHDSVPSWSSRDDPNQPPPASHWTDPPDSNPQTVAYFSPGPIHVEESHDTYMAPSMTLSRRPTPIYWRVSKKRLTTVDWGRGKKLRKWRHTAAFVMKERFSAKIRDETLFPRELRSRRLRDRLRALHALPPRKLNPWARTPSPEELRELEAIKSSLAPPTPEFSRVPNTKGQRQWNSQVICDELSAWARAGNNPSTFYAKKPEANRALKMLAALQSPPDITGFPHDTDSKNELTDDSADTDTQPSGGSEPKMFPSFPHSTVSLLHPSFSPLKEEPEPDMQSLLTWAASESVSQDPALETELPPSPSEPSENSYAYGPRHVWLPPQARYTVDNMYHSPYRAPLPVGLVGSGEYVRGASPLRVPLPPIPSYPRGPPRKPLVLPMSTEDKESSDLPRKPLVMVNKSRNPPRMPIVLGDKASVDTGW